MSVDLTQLNPPDTAPMDGRQFVAWAIDEGRRFRGIDDEPRWVVCHYAADWPRGVPFWRWSVPGRSTSVKILGWLDLPWNDAAADAALGRDRA